jgi:hypothetical protein
MATLAISSSLNAAAHSLTGSLHSLLCWWQGMGPPGGRGQPGGQGSQSIAAASPQASLSTFIK